MATATHRSSEWILLRLEWIAVALFAASACTAAIDEPADGESSDQVEQPQDDGAGGGSDDGGRTDPEAEATCPAPVSAPLGSGKRLRVVYLVPSDRSMDPEHVEGLENAVADVQSWFHKELGSGESFVLSEPIVEVVQTSNPSSHYEQSAVEGYSERFYYWGNGLSDAFEATGAQFSDPHNFWLFFLAADISCESSVGAVDGVSLFSIRDLQALSGQPVSTSCSWDEGKTRCDWVGGVVTNILAGLSVPDPAACVDESDATECPDGLATQWGAFPDSFLSDDQREFLLDTGFFESIDVAPCSDRCAQ